MRKILSLIFILSAFSANAQSDLYAKTLRFATTWAGYDTTTTRPNFTQFANPVSGKLRMWYGGVKNTIWPISVPASGLTIGTTTITGGTNTNVLRNNSGILGEYAVSGSGNVAMTTNPVFTTPDLGVAQATSLVVNGTAGSGFLNLNRQTSAPSFPSNGVRLFANNNDELAWKSAGGLGFISIVNSGITADRTYTLPDVSGTFALGTGTTNELTYWAGTNTLGSLTTGTYPSLTELSYVKGATSAIQTQLDTRWNFGTASTQTWTAAQNYAMGGNNGAFLNGNMLWGPTGATITANTRMDVIGTGTTTNLIQRWADSGNTLRLSIDDRGLITHAATTGSTFTAVVNGAGYTFNNSANASRTSISLQNTSSGTSARGILNFVNNSNSGLSLSYTSTTHSGTVLGTTVGANTSLVYNIQNAPLILGSNNTARFTIGAAGGLGIGTTQNEGTSGQVLTSAGAGATPTWTTIGGVISGLTADRVPVAASSTTLTDFNGFKYLSDQLRLSADSDLNAVYDLVRLTKTRTSSSGFGNSGTAIISEAETSDGHNETIGRLGWVTTDLTGSAEKSDMQFSTMDASSTSIKMTLTSGGNLDLETGKMIFDATETAGGTTGNQTIDKPSGSVNIAAAGTTVTVTNSFCTTTSHVFAMIETNDATAYVKNVVPGSGSFVINLGAAATAEVRVSFWVIN